MMNSNMYGKEERMWAMIVHLAAFIGFLIPLGNVLGPLVIWLIKREESPFIDRHGKEALNFGITVTIYSAIASILIIVFIGVLLLGALVIFWTIYVIIAAVKANEGNAFSFPLTFRFIK